MVRNLAAMIAWQQRARPIWAAVGRMDTPATPAPSLYQANLSDDGAWPVNDYQACAAPNAATCDKARDITLTFLPGAPRLAVGSRVAVHYDVTHGDARVALSPAARIPVRAGVEAHVDKVTRHGDGNTSLQGRLAAFGVGVWPLGFIPTGWWSDARPSALLMQDIWTHIGGAAAPQRLQLTGVAHQDFVDIRMAGTWRAPHHGEAHVLQQVKLLPGGDTLSGPGALSYTGALPSLSRFIDVQLLPFVGETPVSHSPRAATLSEAVQARATWSPLAADGSGLDLRARLTHPAWEMQGRFTMAAQQNRFAIDFSGHPGALATALQDVHLPRMLGVEDLATRVETSRVLGRAWHRGRCDDAPARAVLHLRGGHDATHGLYGTAELHVTHGTRTDVFSAGLGPKQSRLWRGKPHIADEAGPLELGELPDLHQAICGAHNMALFVTGQQASWGVGALQAWGALPSTQDLWLQARRYCDTAQAWLPVSTLRSLVSVWRAGAATSEPVAPPDAGWCSA